jgi:hypothetical protein
VPIESRRRFFFESVATTGGLRFNIESKLRKLMPNANKFVKPPLIKLRIVGSEDEYVEQDIKEVERKFGDSVILRFVKELESPEITEKVEFLRNLRDQKLSAEEIGLSVLHKNLDELEFKGSFKTDGVFSLLVDNRVDEAFNIVTGSQKTLGGGDFYGK